MFRSGCNRLIVAGVAVVASVVLFQGKARASTGLRTWNSKIHRDNEVLDGSARLVSPDDTLLYPEEELIDFEAQEVRLTPLENCDHDKSRVTHGKGANHGDRQKPKRKSLLSEYISHIQRVLTTAQQEQETQISIETDFMALFDAFVFLFAIFVGGHLVSYLGMPSLVGEITIGFLLGPPLADFVPYAESFVLFGDIGLVLLLVEAGIDIDIAQLKVTGGRSLAIAVTGALVALMVGTGLAFATHGVTKEGAVALGAVFSPTSLGVASNALSAGKVLNTPVGQLIVAACVIDDVIGLVILSLIEVLVDEEANIADYLVPLISAVGYLIVLGYIAIAWMPTIVEKWILPRFAEAMREPVAFLLMILLLMGYMPLLHFCKASYLTGAFLAGLSFNQIHSIHSSFINYTKNTMAWLLRIFFAASIGFQVPIRLYSDPLVIAWGFAFYVAVLAKLPLGFFAPRQTAKKVAKGYPFNPYWRDVLITGLSMTSRGEFSFIIASFAVGEKLISESLYASVVWAVLLSCVTSPFMLLVTIRHYNRLAEGFLDAEEVPEDHTMPLYLVIQARTGLIWGLRDLFHRALDELGLVVIDHRSWHPRGLDAIVVTEIYVQDRQTKITIPVSGEVESTGGTDSDKDVDALVASNEVEVIDKRCREVTEKLLKALESRGGSDAAIQVTQWMRAVYAGRKRSYDGEMRDALAADADHELQAKEYIDTTGLGLPSIPEMSPSVMDVAPRSSSDQVRRGRTSSVMTPRLSGVDMWEVDKQAQTSAIRGLRDSSALASYDVDSGVAYGGARRRKVTSDQSVMVESLPTVGERLEGHVRRGVDETETQRRSGRLDNDTRMSGVHPKSRTS